MLRRALVTLIGITTVLMVSVPSAGAASNAGISLSAGSAVPGTQIFVTGQGFPAHSVVRLAICGNAAARGSVDCDQESSATLAPSDQGSFRIPLPVVAPPAPCPCVVQATSIAIDGPVNVPFIVSGVPTAAVQQLVISEVPLKVVASRLTGWGPITAWFGAAPQRMLVLTLRNPSAESLDIPPFTLTRGGKANADTIVRTVSLGALGAGETQTYRIPVRFDVVSHGQLSVAGEVGVPGRSATFVAGTKAFPWGLVAVLIVVVQLVLLAVRDRARRHLNPRLLPESLRPRRASVFEAADPMDYWGWPDAPISPNEPVAAGQVH
jgi:hypothetical protein